MLDAERSARLAELVARGAGGTLFPEITSPPTGWDPAVGSRGMAGRIDRYPSPMSAVGPSFGSAYRPETPPRADVSS